MKAYEILRPVEVDGTIFGRTVMKKRMASFAVANADGSATPFGMLRSMIRGYSFIVDRADLEPAGTPVDDLRRKGGYERTEREAIVAAARLYFELGAEIGAES